MINNSVSPKVAKFVLFGEPASKANSRRAVMIAGKSRLIKSKKALDYVKCVTPQIPPRAKVMFDVPVRATMTIYYCSERPDLDESLILDILQAKYAKHPKTGEKVLVEKGVYTNDRLVREKHVYHAIDKSNPRTEIIIEPLQAVQQDLLSA